MASSANHSVAAVTPEPQLVMTGWSRSTPPAANFSLILSGVDQPAVLDQPGHRHVPGARHVARTDARPRLGIFAAEARGGPRIDHLGASCRAAPSARRTTPATTEVFSSALNFRGVRLDRAGFGRPAFGLPLRQAAVEDVDVLRAEDAERPPHPRRAAEADAVIDHDGVVGADAERAGLLGELGRAGQHVRQLGGMVGDGVDIEERRAGNMGGDELGLGVALERRQVERAVDDRDLGLAQPRREPVGGDQVLA